MGYIKQAGTISRRDVIKYSVAAMVICELTGMPTAYAQSAFTLGTSGGTWGDGIRKAFIEDPGFEDKRDIRVNALNAPTSVLVSRLLANPANPVFTVADMLDVEHFLAADSGAIQDYDLDIVTNYKDVFPTARHAPRAGLNNWCASMTLPLIAITYNTREVKEAPSDWQDLWSDRFKGRIGIPDFGWYGMTWLHAINKHLGGTEDDISVGVDAVRDLVRNNNAIVIRNQEQAIKAFSDGEIFAMPYWNGRAFSLQENGVPVGMAYIPGTIQLRNGMVIAKNTDLATEANHFVNNTLDPELQLHMTRTFRYPPSNKKAQLPSDLAHLAAPESALEKVVDLDWGTINEGRVEALERWNREILG